MSILSWLFGGGMREIAGGVKDVAEVFRVNAEAEASREHLEHEGARAQFAAEFRPAGSGFDGLVDGLNRLPRPALALGCLGLFAYAMADPVGFAARMQGLALVPEPLWWLLGAIVSFYFGARELHHMRRIRDAGVAPDDVARTVAAVERVRALAPAAPASPASPAALRDPERPGAGPAVNPALTEFASRAA